MVPTSQEAASQSRPCDREHRALSQGRGQEEPCACRQVQYGLYAQMSTIDIWEGRGSRTRPLRIIFRDLSPELSAACQSADHPYSKPVFNPSSMSAGLHLNTHPPRNSAPHPASFLTLSVAVAMGARDRGAPLSTTTHGRSIRPPWLVYTAATAWLNRCHWCVWEPAMAGASSHGANRNCSPHDTPPTGAASLPHPCTACWYAVQWPRHADVG